MKVLLLTIFALAFSACKEINKTQDKVNISAFETKSYLSIRHEENKSVLRNKMLNLAFTRQMKIKDESVIKDSDFFNFSTESFSFSDNDKIVYKNLKDSCAEILVSYADHLEIYFVPHGINRDQALLDLQLQKEEGKSLFWAIETPAVLSKGQSYYLLSAGRNEILKNDQFFSYQKHEFTDFVETAPKSFSLTNNQKIVLTFKINFAVKQTAITEVSLGRQRSCKKDELEAGMCGPCTAKIEALTGNFIAKDWASENIPMSVTVNGKTYLLNEFEAVLNADHSLTVIIDLMRYSSEKNVEVKIMPVTLQPHLKAVSGFDYFNCRGTNLQRTLDLTPRFQRSYQTEIFGRQI